MSLFLSKNKCVNISDEEPPKKVLNRSVRPSDDILEIRPLIPEEWDWFALDKVNYHNKMISIVWDRIGGRYGLGKGFTVFVDAIEKHNSSKIVDLRIKL